MLDWDLVCSRLAAESPRYEPGTRHGYHGITYGFLVGEVIHRVTGMSVHDAVETEIVKPLDLDGMSIGATPEVRGRLAELILRFGDADRIERFAVRAAQAAWLRPAIETFVVPGSDRLYASSNVLDGPIPALNGCFTARSLARMYATLAGGGVLDGERFLSAETLRRATEIQTTRPDIVVGYPMKWRLGYHVAATTRGIIPNGFGHFGFGGSGAWADPDNDLAVGLHLQPRRGHAVRRPAIPPHRRARRAPLPWRAELPLRRRAGDGPRCRRDGARSVPPRGGCTGSSAGHGHPPNPVAR